MVEDIISIAEYPISKISRWKLFMKHPYTKISLYMEFDDHLDIDPKISKKVFFEVEVDGINFFTYTFTLGNYQLKLNKKSMDNYTYKHLKTFNEMHHTTSIIGNPPGFSIFKFIKNITC